LGRGCYLWVWLGGGYLPKRRAAGGGHARPLPVHG
jgi:hypothetical protein